MFEYSEDVPGSNIYDGLKPCPFCGGQAYIHVFDDTHGKGPYDIGHCQVQCSKCTAMKTYRYITSNDARRAWNKRFNDTEGVIHEQED